MKTEITVARITRVFLFAGFLFLASEPAHATPPPENPQVFPPDACTADPGNYAAMGWDGYNNTACMPIINRTGIGAVTITGKVGIGTENPGAPLDIVVPNSGAGLPNSHPLLMQAADGHGRGSVEIYGGADMTIYPDETASALRVRSIDGTGRSITAAGSIAAGQGGYFMGDVGIGTKEPGARLEVVLPESGVGQGLFNAVIAHVLDGNYRPVIEVMGGADGAAYPDDVAAALRVASIDGTGRSITTKGTVMVGGDGLFDGVVGIGTATVGNGARLHVYGTANGILGEAHGGIGAVGVFGRAVQLADFGVLGKSEYSSYFCYLGTSGYSIFCNGPTAGVSDERLKKDIELLSAAEGLSAIMALEPVHYRWKDERKNPGGRREMGFTAQNVEKVLPELVSETEQGGDTRDPNVDGKIKALSYDRLAAPLVKAVQQLKAENDALRKDVDELRRSFESLTPAHP